MTKNNITNRPMYIEGNLVERIQNSRKKEKRNNLLKKAGLTLTGLAALGAVSAFGGYAVKENLENKKDNYFNNLQTQEYTIKKGDKLWNIVNENYDNIDPRKVVYDIKKLNDLEDVGNLQPRQKIELPDYTKPVN